MINVRHVVKKAKDTSESNKMLFYICCRCMLRNAGLDEWKTAARPNYRYIDIKMNRQIPIAIMSLVGWQILLQTSRMFNGEWSPKLQTFLGQHASAVGTMLTMEEWSRNWGKYKFTLEVIVAKKWDPGSKSFSAQIRKVEARLGKLAKIRKVEPN